MEIYFSWIGNWDLGAAEGKDNVRDADGPVCAVLKEVQFDRVLLLSNYEEQRGENYKAWLATRVQVPIEVVQVSLDSPMDFDGIYKATMGALGGVRDRVKQDVRWTFNLSPGTMAMGSILLLLGKTAFPAKIINTSPEAGVTEANIPFDLSAEYLPKLNKVLGDYFAASVTSEEVSEANMIGEDDQFLQALGRGKRAAQTDMPVLINGESGTGKERLATFIHKRSKRYKHKLHIINCGAIPENLVDSTLFGYVKGAFSGADKSRAGVFEDAHQSTLFLDEVAELSPDAQVRLLRVLQEGKIRRVGDHKEISVDVRIISASHKNLIDEVRAGRFREDLFYRLAVVSLKLPPLRERKNDISALVAYFWNRILLENQVDGEERKLSPTAKNVLQHHSWPGNIRELENTLKRLYVLTPPGRIDAASVRENLFEMTDSKPSESILNIEFGASFDVDAVQARVYLHYYDRAEKAAKTKAERAELMGLASFQTMENRKNRSLEILGQK